MFSFISILIFQWLCLFSADAKSDVAEEKSSPAVKKGKGRGAKAAGTKMQY